MVEISKEIIAAKDKAESELLKLPGVTGVDIGYKEVGGQKTGVIAIRVLVEKKKPNPPEKERVPAEIGGHPTDVIERKFELFPVYRARKRVEALVPEADTGTYSPLKGGISIGPTRSVGGFVYAGTLGAIATDNVSGKHMLLSNFHVMCIDSTFHIGDPQVQPSLVDGGSSTTSVVGTLARESLGGSVDCAVATVTATRGESCEIVDIGAVAGTNTTTLGEPVRKRGRTTGLTYGIVDSVNLSVNIDYGAGIGVKTLTSQIGVKPDTTHNPKFGDHGDSGSVVVNNAREVVGLHFAGDSTGYGIANPIAAVLAALNVKLCTEPMVKIKDHKVEKLEKIEIKEKETIKDQKDAKYEKLEIKEHKDGKREKLEIKEHKDGKFEKIEKIESKGIAKLEHPEKPIGKEKDGKELKEGGFEGPGGPGGGDPLQAGGKLADTHKLPKLEKLEKSEIKEVKIEKLEKPEHKEHKDGKLEKPEKFEKRETKELKDAKHEKVEKNEAKEHKDSKNEKLEIKEHKDGKFEKIESKDIAKLEHPEKPIGKEKDGKELKEGGFEGPGGPGEPGGPVEQRLGALEQALAQLTHFISVSQRPDLAHGALSGEPDMMKQVSALSQEAADAKTRKDAKDAEKFADR